MAYIYLTKKIMTAIDIIVIALLTIHFVFIGLLLTRIDIRFRPFKKNMKGNWYTIILRLLIPPTIKKE